MYYMGGSRDRKLPMYQSVNKITNVLIGWDSTVLYLGIGLF